MTTLSVREYNLDIINLDIKINDIEIMYGYLGLIGTGIAFALWFRGIEHLPVTATSFLLLFSPITATLIGWIFLGQSLTLLQLLGAGIVLVSVLFGRFVTAPKASAPGAKTEASRPVASGTSPTHR